MVGRTIPRKSVSERKSYGLMHEMNKTHFNFKIFLFAQSDDHQVVRTRYPAMVHDCGDIVRPGDCVLLRAGSKKNELGYVAKVASLWENPEDGKI